MSRCHAGATNELMLRTRPRRRSRRASVRSSSRPLVRKLPLSRWPHGRIHMPLCGRCRVYGDWSRVPQAAHSVELSATTCLQRGQWKITGSRPGTVGGGRSGHRPRRGNGQTSRWYHLMSPSSRAADGTAPNALSCSTGTGARRVAASGRVLPQVGCCLGSAVSRWRCRPSRRPGRCGRASRPRMRTRRA
jgi:hypothetical protein